jgi:hypothetical protein
MRMLKLRWIKTVITNKLQSSFVFIFDSWFLEGSVEIGIVSEVRVRWWWWWWWAIRGRGRAKGEVLNEAVWAEIVLVLDWSGIEIGTPLTMIH